MRILSLIAIAVPLLSHAQIAGPLLGFVAQRGEIRRIEGLSGSSRLSEPLAGLPACSRIEVPASGRWAVCLRADSKVLIVDLQDGSARTLALSGFERVVWSPAGSSVALDGNVVALASADVRVVDGEVAAISDTGAVALRDASGAIRLNGETVAVVASAVAFDGEALLVAGEGSVTRIEPGRSNRSYQIGITAAFLYQKGISLYAASGRTLVRIDRESGEFLAFDAGVEIAGLDGLTDGSVLVAAPREGEPGWIFSNGRFSFIPGIAVKEEAGQ